MSNDDTLPFFLVQPTTAASFQILDGSVTLVVHALDFNRQVVVSAFDVDAYGLELANNLLAALVAQKDSEGVA